MAVRFQMRAHFLIFLSIMLVILGGAHYYVYARAAHYFGWSPEARRLGAVAMLTLLVCTIAGMSVIRRLPHHLNAIPAWVIFAWMGTLMFLFLSFLATDLVSLATSVSMAPDPARRRLFGGVALTLAGGLSGYALWNGLRPVEVKPVTVTLARLPRALDGLRIVQLTDLHLGPTIDGMWMQRIVDETNALKPDIVAITGDLVDGSVEDIGDFALPLRDLKARHGVFFVTGNHDYYSNADAWCDHVTTLGIRCLRNAHVGLDIAGARLTLAGIEDHSARNFPGHSSDVGAALAGSEDGTPVVLMAHQPVSIFDAARHKVDLQLSGHTHGGQIWPWNYLVPLQQPYVKGLHRHEDTEMQIYVSSGTGYWGPPMRLGTAAEVTLITLRSPASKGA